MTKSCVKYFDAQNYKMYGENICAEGTKNAKI